jgi:hypothetical protein
MIRELLSQTDLASAPVAALVLFFLMFAALVVHAWLRADESRAEMPLHDASVPPRPANVHRDEVPHG